MKQKNKDGSTREYLYVVENQRVNGKIRQKVIANLGRIDKELSEEKLASLAASICKHTENKKILDLCTDIDNKKSQTYGEILIYRKLWKELKFDKLFRKYFADTQKEIDLVEAIFAMVCNRLIAPSSKREVHEWVKEVYEPEWEKYQLHHYYRAMDFLAEKKELMEVELFDTTKDLFSSKVDIVMFDTTNISYWGQGHEGTLMQYGGAPKNKRKDLKQLVVGIMMDRDGTPLGHEVWPGNMSDMPALKEIVTKIKSKFSIGKVIIVCDRGMISEANIAYLEENNYEYILGVKMRKLNQTRRRLLLANKDFRAIKEGLLGKSIKEYELRKIEIIEQNTLRVKDGKNPVEFTDQDLEEYKKSSKGQRTWAVCLNEFVAREDASKREYFQKIIEGKVENSTAKEWIIKNGYKKYIDVESMELKLNYKKLEEDELYDGKWCLMSNTNFPVGSLIMVYKDLARIERHFRDLKSELEIGPIRHRKDRRVRAHVFICFLALQLKFALTRKLKELDPEISYSEVMRDVSRIKAITTQIKEEEIITRTELDGKAFLAFKAASCQIPPKLLKKSVVYTPA